jgi:hypothetical protein
MPTSPIAMALDADNHDLYLDDNFQIAFFSSTKQRVEQKIRCRLQTVKGELYQNPEIGVAYFSDVMVKNPNLVTLKHLFSKAISEVDEVASVDSVIVTFNSASRTCRVEFSVTATDGTSNISGVV